MQNGPPFPEGRLFVSVGLRPGLEAHVAHATHAAHATWHATA